MEEEDRCHTVAVDSPKREWLPLGKFHESQYKRKEEQQYAGRTYKSFLLAYSAEYEVGVLLWHKLQLSLCAFEKSITL